MTEASTLQNFNFGFPTHKSDILIHLSQWQYWWWFWFSLFWSLYLYIILKVWNKRALPFNPIMNTSLRGHGKWGDFLVALIPLSWCGNILVNSNFILRMIEWQNEGSLFTLRVQGKQWYWVYKFDATAVRNILSAPKNIGHDRWFINNANESYCADSYYEAIHMGAQLEFKQRYLDLLKDDGLTKSKLNSWTGKHNVVDFLSKDNQDAATGEGVSVTGFHENTEIDYTGQFSRNILDSTKRKPLVFLAGVLNKHNIELLKTMDETSDKPILFTAKFPKHSGPDNGAISSKPEHAAPRWGFKQKKYKRLEKLQFTYKLAYDPKTLTHLPLSEQPNYNPLYPNKIFEPKYAVGIKDNLIQELHNGFSNPDPKLSQQSFSYHNAIKYNRHRSELVPVTLARRLLRTKRTLVLPAHVNITVITNSLDVVHSWFIPGLGLKMDCVPGRSTHHSFYIDNVGFYYGQCAEICGRFHHHMPVRLCALPFEQFLVWWQRRGVRRLHRIGVINSKTQVNTEDIRFRYKW